MKMTKNLLALLTVLLSLTSFSQVSTEELELQALRAKLKVKSITLMQCDFGYTNGKWVAGAPYKLGKTKYDKKAKDIEEITYDKRGALEAWVLNEFDTKGNYSKMINKQADGKVTYITPFKNTYDSLGRLKELIGYKNDTVPINKITYEYNAKGNLVKLMKYKAQIFFKDYQDKDGTFNGKYTLLGSEQYEYDDKGRTTKTTYYSGDSFLGSGDYIEKAEFKYDEKGKLTEKIADYYYMYKYGANGLETEYTVYDNKNKALYTVKSVYEFNP